MSKDEQAVLTAQTLSSEMIQNHNYHKGLHLAIQILPTFTVTCVQQSDNNMHDATAKVEVNWMSRNDRTPCHMTLEKLTKY